MFFNNLLGRQKSIFASFQQKYNFLYFRLQKYWFWTRKSQSFRCRAKLRFIKICWDWTKKTELAVIWAFSFMCIRLYQSLYLLNLWKKCTLESFSRTEGGSIYLLPCLFILFLFPRDRHIIYLKTFLLLNFVDMISQLIDQVYAQFPYFQSLLIHIYFFSGSWWFFKKARSSLW